MTQAIQNNTKFTSTKNAPVEGINWVESMYYIRQTECAFNLHVGLFFDGTDNNKYDDEDDFGHTNVARLHDAYLNRPDDGVYRIYVPGVGTPFPELGEMEESPVSGGAMGLGCEQRILFGLLAVLNAIHLRAFGKDKEMFTEDQIRVLCTRSEVRDETEKAFLSPLGLGRGLMMNNTPQPLLKHLVALLEHRLKSPTNKVKIGECMIDVFGFSRGAAQARVFCTWLSELLIGGKLAGIIIQLRFVGLFDTVASHGGVVGTAANFLINRTGGHYGWAKPSNLRIPASVKYCVHMVAMHELRKNFPLDSLVIERQLPSNCREFAYPGTHSDVGGGYKPGQLGVAVGKTPMEGDALKLSQIPLNHMLACAMAACVPIKKEFAEDKKTKHNPFTTDPRVEQAYASFLAAMGNAPRFLHEWAQPYLNWRWQVRENYTELSQVQNAAKEDRALMLATNKSFIHIARLIDDDVRKSRSLFSVGQRDSHAYQREMGGGVLDPEAPMILDIVQQAPPLSLALKHFFDRFVHDSYAGFSKSMEEATSYWRYRKVFEGDNVALIGQREPDKKTARG